MGNITWPVVAIVAIIAAVAIGAVALLGSAGGGESDQTTATEVQAVSGDELSCQAAWSEVRDSVIGLADSASRIHLLLEEEEGVIWSESARQGARAGYLVISESLHPLHEALDIACLE